jgi:predicted phage-related endonuclease
MLIEADRFVANKAMDFEGWLEARLHGVTATQVAKAATPAGYREVLAGLLNPVSIDDNDYMRFGREQEGPIGMWVKDFSGVMPNEWLIAHDTNRHHLATPDGISLSHDTISEVKTTGKDWLPVQIPIAYRRQVQWQLHVTGTDRCVFAWMLRVEVNGVFQPGWFEPKWMSIRRDPNMILELSAVADKLWDEVTTIRKYERES